MWARRFIVAAILQGTVAWFITIVLLVMDLPVSGFVSPARVVAFGSAGMWFTVGYLGYIIFPVIGTGLSALFYHYVESVLGRKYEGGLEWLAWGHLLIGNVGIGLGLLLMMWGGYQAGVAMLPTDVGGLGKDAVFVGTNILGPITVPISALLILGSFGPLLGGIGFTLQIRKKA